MICVLVLVSVDGIVLVADLKGRFHAWYPNVIECGQH